MGFHDKHNYAEANYDGFTRLGNQVFTSLTNIVYQGDTTPIPLARSVYVSGPSAAVTTWELRNHSGLVTHTGGAIPSGGSWTPPVLPCGWYRLYLFSAGRVPMGGGCLVVTRNVVGMANPPASLMIRDSGELFIKTMTGSVRMDLDAAAPSNGYSANDEALSAITTYADPVDTARPKPKLMNFPNGTSGKSAGVSAAVARYTTVDWWEGENEPNGVPGASFVANQREFYNAVKAGRAGAKVLGPCPVTIGGAATNNLRAFFAAGGGNYVDVVSFHTYNAHMGDLRCGRRSWDSWIALLATYGQHMKPRANTEAGGFFAAEYGAGVYMRQASLTMLDLLLNEQYGVQKESWWYFYAKSHGFDDFPSFLTGENGQPFPAVGCLLTHSQELLGTTWNSRLDFGTVDNDYIIGSSYRRADSTGVVSIMAAGKRDTPVTLQLTGGSPATVTVVDSWGNQTSIPVSGSLATVTASVLPIYVRLPAGVTAEPVSTRYGTNRIAGCTVSSSVGSQPNTVISSVIDGTFPNNLFYDQANGADANSVWQSGAAIAVGDTQTLTFDLGSQLRVNTVMVHCPPPWQVLAVIQQATIQARVGGVWNTVGTINENPTVIEWLSNKEDSVNGYYDSFWDDAHIFEIQFPRVVCDALRINVTRVSFGGSVSLSARLAYGHRDNAGATVSAGLGTYTPRVALQRFTAFDAPAGAMPQVSGTRYLVRHL